MVECWLPYIGIYFMIPSNLISISVYLFTRNITRPDISKLTPESRRNIYSQQGQPS